MLPDSIQVDGRDAVLSVHQLRSDSFTLRLDSCCSPLVQHTEVIPVVKIDIDGRFPQRSRKQCTPYAWKEKEGDPSSFNTVSSS